MQSVNRREFVSTVAAAGAGLALGIQDSPAADAVPPVETLFKISIAEYSLHRMLERGELDPRDFGPFCAQHFGVDAVDYWMGPYQDKATNHAYMDEMKQKSADAGVTGLLIMIDIPGGKGNLGNPDTAARTVAIESHFPWVEAAQRMGCHSIRVNARSEGNREEQAKLAADGLRRLCEFAAPHNINIIVENHGGLSSDGKWLSEVIQAVDLPNCGTLPDFGNFCVVGSPSNCRQPYDRYQGTAELMPFARSVSAKSYGFDDAGNETTIDYRRMMKIVVDAGYHDYVGVEWEGRSPDEIKGTQLTKTLLEKVREELAASPA